MVIYERLSCCDTSRGLIGVIAGCWEDFWPGPVISRPPEVTRASESVCARSFSRTDVSFRVVDAVLRDRWMIYLASKACCLNLYTNVGGLCSVDI